jgi:hypothetical protein
VENQGDLDCPVQASLAVKVTREKSKMKWESLHDMGANFIVYLDPKSRR